MSKAIFILTALIWIVCTTAAATAAEFLSYEELVTKIQEGSIKTVVLHPGRPTVSGRLLKEGVEIEFSSWLPGPKNDALLLKLLREQNVEVQTATENGMFERYYMPISSLLVIGIPVISLIVLLRVNKRVKRVESAVCPEALQR